MRKIDVLKSIEVEAKTENVWQIIGPKILNIADWAGGIFKSWEDETAEKKLKMHLLEVVSVI